MFRATVIILAAGVCGGSVALAQGVSPRYGSGQATYLQREAEVTVALVAGSSYDVDSIRQRRGATLTFSPGGKSGAQPAFYLQFWISGTSNPFIVALEVRGGQGGTAYFDQAESHCTLTVTRLDAQAVEGSGSCTGSFEGGGAPVARFTFAARK
jgi:hypothetical protein